MYSVLKIKHLHLDFRDVNHKLVNLFDIVYYSFSIRKVNFEIC